MKSPYCIELQKRFVGKAFDEWVMDFQGKLTLLEYVTLTCSTTIDIDYWKIEIMYLSVFGKGVIKNGKGNQCKA